MSEIVSLFTVLSPHLSGATLRQLCEIVFAVLAMTGSVLTTNIASLHRHRTTLPQKSIK